MTLKSISVGDLIGRIAINPNGVPFRIIEVSYDLQHDWVWFNLADPDNPEDVNGVTSLAGWTVL